MDRLHLPFRTDSCHTDNKKYCDELYTFLENHQTIHSVHPEDYFRLEFHLNGGKKTEVQEWLSALGSLIKDKGESVVSELLQLSSVTTESCIWKDVKTTSESLFEFAMNCNSLRLSRDQKNNQVSETTTDSHQQQKFLTRIIDSGMSDKKKHEVTMMYKNIKDSLMNNDDIKTIINIGEGKGYLSRALALCKGLQVIGLDCNPHHRDSSFERIDRILCSRIFDDGDSFLYEPRGAMFSLTCHVDPNLNWSDLLSKLPKSNSVVEAEVPQISSKMKCATCNKIIKGHLPMLLGHLSYSHPGNTVPESLNEAEMWNWIKSYFCEYEPMGSEIRISGQQFKRGCRLVLPKSICNEHKKSKKKKKETDDDTPAMEPTDDDTTTDDVGTELVTVLGYDDSTDRYKILRHATKSRMCLPLPTDVDKVNTIDPSVYPINDNLRDVMMIGLHTCGDLGSTTLKLWHASESNNLTLVSCCWHSLTKNGFPLSKYVSNRQFPSTVTELSLMLATQPVVEGLSDDDLSKFLSSKRLLFFRAMLPLYWPTLSSCYSSSKEDRFQTSDSLPPIFLRDMSRMKSDLTFEQFISSIEKYGFAPSEPPCDKTPASIEQQYMESDFSSFLALVILRNWMSQLIESAFVIDRALMLSEKGCDVRLDSIFDGALSPRNFAIIANR